MRTRSCSRARARVALEFAEQATFDTLLVAVGGGGLIAGCAAAIGEGTKIVAVETEGTPTLYEARRAGRPVDVAISGIAADALGASRIGTPNFEIAQKLVRDAVLVSDDAVRIAQRALWEELRIDRRTVRRHRPRGPDVRRLQARVRRARGDPGLRRQHRSGLDRLKLCWSAVSRPARF